MLGAGGWGTALAVHVSRGGHHATLWGRDASLVADIASRRTNDVYLPGVTVPEAVCLTSDIQQAVRMADFVLCAVPSQGTRDVLRLAAAYVPADAIIVSATKGLEQHSLLRVSEIIAQELGDRRVAVISGPSFAAEVADRLPTAVSIASLDLSVVNRVQTEFRSASFRLYGTTDVVGVEIGGALKNVIAIAAGVAEGLGLGQSARAALITRGLAEITRLACATGGRAETLAGLSGLGDLVLTCTGSLSRNHRLGIELASGRSLEAIMAGMRTVAEGIRTADASLALGARFGVELPIAAKVSELLSGRKDARTAVDELMMRPQRAEV